MDYGPVWIAVIVAIPTILTSFFAPIITLIIQNRAARAERQENYTRQDLLDQKLRENARLLLASNDLATTTAKTTSDKLDIIHSLVNSNMTAALQGEVDASMRELAMMLEVIDLKTKAGCEPTAIAIATVETTKKKIVELSNIIADRKNPPEKGSA